jgi:hypothetical protein
MKSFSYRAACAIALVFSAGTSYADPIVVNFESPTDLFFIGATYAGLSWHPGVWEVETQSDPYNAHSGTKIAFFFGGIALDSKISFATASEFDGAYFSGRDFANLVVHLYLAGSEVFTSAVIHPTATSTLYANGYTGAVDAVSFSSGPGFFWVMDDFMYSPLVAAVPEPETYALMLAGVALIGLRRRRRQWHRTESSGIADRPRAVFLTGALPGMATCDQMQAPIQSATEIRPEMGGST